jgi:Family of unknown function (DUF695)
MITSFGKHPWKTGKVEYEGFPLLLRFPDDIEYDNPNPAFPVLLTITHTLTQVQNSGLPELEYNNTLEDFDVRLTGLFDNKDLGVLVLVETFAGKRSYYFYVAEIIDLENEESAIRGQYPQHELRWESRADPDWKFIKRYASDFKFNGAQAALPADGPATPARR